MNFRAWHRQPTLKVCSLVRARLAVAVGVAALGCTPDDNATLLSQEWACAANVYESTCFCIEPEPDVEPRAPGECGALCCGAERYEDEEEGVTYLCECTPRFEGQLCRAPERGRAVDTCPPKTGFIEGLSWSCVGGARERYALVPLGPIEECGPRQGECCVSPGTLATTYCTCGDMCGPGVHPVPDCEVNSFSEMNLPLVTGWSCTFQPRYGCSCTEATLSFGLGHSNDVTSVACNGATSNCCLYTPAVVGMRPARCECSYGDACTGTAEQRRVTTCPPSPDEL